MDAPCRRRSVAPVKKRRIRMHMTTEMDTPMNTSTDTCITIDLKDECRGARPRRTYSSNSRSFLLHLLVHGRVGDLMDDLKEALRFGMRAHRCLVHTRSQYTQHLGHALD